MHMHMRRLVIVEVDDEPKAGLTMHRDHQPKQPIGLGYSMERFAFRCSSADCAKARICLFVG